MQKIGLRMAGVMWVWFCSQGVAMAERVLAGNRVEMQDLTLNLPRKHSLMLTLTLRVGTGSMHTTHRTGCSILEVLALVEPLHL